MYSVKTFDQYINKIVDYIKKNPPTCNEEFKLYTKYFYGVELNCIFNCYSSGGYYEVRERESDYSKIPLYRCWEKKFGWYDGLKVLLNNTFGPLYCGGVGGSHYGQFEVTNTSAEKLNELNKRWMLPLEDVYRYIKEAEIMQLLDMLPVYK